MLLSLKTQRFNDRWPPHIAFTHFSAELGTFTLTYVLVGLPVDQAVDVPSPCAGHPEQERVGLDHVAVAGFKLVAGDQERGVGS